MSNNTPCLRYRLLWTWKELLLVASSLYANSHGRYCHGFVLDPTNARTAARSENDDNNQNNPDHRYLRIRTAQKDDLAPAAAFLSTAHTTSSDTKHSWLDIRAKMDQILAQNDIEALLRGRYEAIEAGKTSLSYLQSLMKQQQQQQYQPTSSHCDAIMMREHAGRVSPFTHDDNVLHHWWNSPQTTKFKLLLEKASSATGENNVWRHHNWALTPPTTHWFRHLQMTAHDVRTGDVVGFCEIGMLENPLVTDDDDHNQFAPAIANLATAPSWRRRGVATRLLQSAQTYVERYWTSTHTSNSCHNRLALFVDLDNDAALSLYEKLGFQKAVVSSTVERSMWYMVKDLAASKGPEEQQQQPQSAVPTVTSTIGTL